MDNYKITNLLFEELITFDLEANTYEEVIKKIGNDAHKKGYVKSGFANAVLKREKLYPTALPTNVLKVAIPHPIERDTVEKSAIIVTKLKHPVDFVLMGSENELVPVEIVFTLAVNGGQHQLHILQDLVSMFSDEGAMEKIKSANSAPQMMHTLIDLLS